MCHGAHLCVDVIRAGAGRERIELLHQIRGRLHDDGSHVSELGEIRGDRALVCVESDGSETPVSSFTTRVKIIENTII